MIMNFITSLLAQIRELHDWCFRTPTRLIELISGFCAFFFASAFLMDLSLFVVNHPYRNFAYLSNKWLWVVMLFLSILQLVFAGRSTLKSNEKSAQLLLWFSLIWIIISVVFATDSPPISPAFFTYTVLSFVKSIWCNSPFVILY